ncbi:Oligopeptidase A [Mucor velutinosus]|uniref:Oligopeptidase A n=1 Tax=Mucor velutinosus TaxID=708070 RepID=A0AAN7DQY3_9FUNG|nr:Oligopeptidase A [Mucor velutinosus]
MICQNPTTSTTLPRPKRQDALERKFSLNPKSNDITKRHTIASFCEYDLGASNCRTLFKASGLDQDPSTACNVDTLEQQTNKSSRNHKYYWETIESYYVNRLNALQKDIETATQQNSKLSMAREDLVQEVLKLHQKSMTLNARNDQLSRSIAEKETHISAFMYGSNQPTSSVQHQDNYGPIVGVTLVDQPLSTAMSPPAPPSPPADITNNESIPSTEPATAPTATEAPVKKETGIFRQISLRLSSRKRRQQQQQPQQEETQQHPSSSLHITEPLTDAVSSSSSDSILHPAVVISSPHSSNRLHQQADEDSSTSFKRKKNLIFGNDLIQQARSENSVIPSVVLKCVREVEARGLSVEGIYRKSGTLGQVKELQDAFDENKNPKLSKYQDINVITSLLKLYFRELSTPLLPGDFILPHSLNNQERLNKTYAILHNMPIESYCTIKFLVQHLRRVHENHSVNRMPLKNLAMVFGPTLLRFHYAGNEEQQMREMIDTVEFIIQQSHILFADYS